MLLTTKNEAKALLLACGYKKHFDSFIKKDHGGRFHARVLGSRRIELHYDLFIDGGRSHFAPPMPIKTGAELKFIQKIDEENKIKDKTPTKYQGFKGKHKKKVKIKHPIKGKTYLKILKANRAKEGTPVPSMASN